MATHNFSAESPENYEQKCCCALVLDVSSSMQGTPIDELNEGLEAFFKDIQMDSTTANRLEIAIVVFNNEVRTLVEPDLVANIKVPKLTASGSTRLVDGVQEGISIVKARKTWYKETGQPYYRPWVILMTDGDPDDLQDITSLSPAIRKGMANKEFYFYAIGVQDADMKKLNEISDPSMPAAKLKGLKFSEFFRWLSASMTAITKSSEGNKINLPKPSDWMAGFTI